jgi:hypothetical protein
VEHLWFDVMHAGRRYRMPVNDFAVPRMEPGKQRPIESLEQARDWERLFIGEIKAGRDPRPKPARKEPAPDVEHVGAFLDAYFERHLKPAGDPQSQHGGRTFEGAEAVLWRPADQGLGRCGDRQPLQSRE